MDLCPVVIDDLFPLGVSYAGTYSIQDNAAVITCVDQADGPDWVVCTYDGVLDPEIRCRPSR